MNQPTDVFITDSLGRQIDNILFERETVKALTKIGDDKLELYLINPTEYIVFFRILKPPMLFIYAAPNFGFIKPNSNTKIESNDYFSSKIK
jgi:hypothetical protein